MFLSLSLGTRVSGSYGRNLGRFARPGRSLGMPGAHRSPARSPDWWSPYVPPLGLSATGPLASELPPWMGWSHAPLIFDAFAMVQSPNQQSESSNQDIYPIIPISVALPKIGGMFTIPTWVVYPHGIVLPNFYPTCTQLLPNEIITQQKSPTRNKILGVRWHLMVHLLHIRRNFRLFRVGPMAPALGWWVHWSCGRFNAWLLEINGNKQCNGM